MMIIKDYVKYKPGSKHKSQLTAIFPGMPGEVFDERKAKNDLIVSMVKLLMDLSNQEEEWKEAVDNFFNIKYIGPDENGECLVEATLKL